MKATMDANGVITLKAESSIEAYALSRWVNQAVVSFQTVAFQEDTMVRGSMLVVDASDGTPPAATNFDSMLPGKR